MRTLLCILMVTCASAAVTGVSVQDPTRQQTVISFNVTNPNSCFVTVYEDSARTIKVNDTNNELIIGSESCVRPFNPPPVGTRVRFVVGLRGVGVADRYDLLGWLAGKLFSRSLAVTKTYWYTITDGTDGQTAQGSFTTSNIP